jgi:hypothetical protein
MTVDPFSAHATPPESVREIAPPIARTGQRVAVAASQGEEEITGVVVEVTASTSTNPGHLMIYDVKNKRLVIKSPAPSSIASA